MELQNLFEYSSRSPLSVNLQDEPVPAIAVQVAPADVRIPFYMPLGHAFYGSAIICFHRSATKAEFPEELAPFLITNHFSLSA